MIKPDYFRIYWHRRSNNCGWHRDRFDIIERKTDESALIYRGRKHAKYKYNQWTRIGGLFIYRLEYLQRRG